MTICTHNPENWTETDDNCTYCELCQLAVCPDCATVWRELELIDTDGAAYDPACDCESEVLI